MNTNAIDSENTQDSAAGGGHWVQRLTLSCLDTITEMASTDPTASAYEAAYALNAIPAYVSDEGDDSEWWDSEDAHWYLEGLFDALNDLAPEGYYFGSHEGNGSDYGFWPIST